MNPEAPEDYLFRFDTPPASRVFGNEYRLSGWLVDRAGKDVLGLRALVKRPFRKAITFKGRRKRERPDIAIAFPHLPAAPTSGFLFELELGLGRNHLTFQVRGEDRVWRTFATREVRAVPLNFLRALRLPEVRTLVLERAQKRHAQRLHRRASSVPVANISSASSLTTKQVDLFATTRSNLFIIEIAQLIAAGFRALGLPTQLHLDEIPNPATSSDHLQLIITPHEFYNLFLRERVTTADAESLTKNAVLLCTEQPETGWFYNNLRWAALARAVADINPLGVAAYQARDLPAFHLQLGYHSFLAAPKLTPFATRPCEITFLGSLTARREMFFAENAFFFSQHRSHIRFVPLGFAKTKQTRSYLSSETRNELLSQSRILLNVHYSDQAYMEWHRLLMGLANRCCVITETSSGYGSLVPGRHFIMAEQRDLIACCDYYLNHPAEAEAIAQQGTDFIQTQLTQAESCARFLRAIEENKPRPIVVSDALPVPLPAELGTKLSRQHRQQMREAFGRDLRNWSQPPPPISPEEEESVVSLKERRQVVIAKREACHQRWLAQEEKRTQGEVPWATTDNATYADVSPRLSVVVTLYNYARYLPACLTSVEQSTRQLGQPIELVIIDDHSSDSSLAEALRYQSESSLPTRIIAKEFNTGLADSRNIGTQAARAPFVLMMDADNLLMPQALSQLLAAIESGEHVAAYSILCRFTGKPPRRMGLLSQYDWDPQILVQHPYIDAMALFRRETLLELGGYDNELSQVGWFGWEDYEMWLRFAQRNLSVAFVPNILCLYRHHERSMINLTNLFEVDLVRHLAVRYRELIERFEPSETLFGVERSKLYSPSNQAGGNASSKPGSANERLGL